MTMTILQFIESGVEQATYARLSLADAMREALGEDRVSEDEQCGEPLKVRSVASRKLSGFRFRRCGGGRQVIRRQRGGA